jgi:hypothetical protein
MNDGQTNVEMQNAQEEIERLRKELGILRKTLEDAQPFLTLALAFLLEKQNGRIIQTDYRYAPALRTWDASSAGGAKMLGILSERHQAYLTLLDSFAPFRADFARIPISGDPEGTTPFWVNGWLPAFDSASIYGLLATRNPSLYVEIGSGNSTKFARQAIADHKLRTKIISIDPQPRAAINSICDENIRLPCEEIPTQVFSGLGQDAVLFVDNSHRSFQNSDVTVFFTEILPALQPGVVWGLHDICLPLDYPAEWASRYYNEQYLLMSYLFGGGGQDQVLLPNAYMALVPDLHAAFIKTVFSGSAAGIELFGGCFWMERRL